MTRYRYALLSLLMSVAGLPGLAQALFVATNDHIVANDQGRTDVEPVTVVFDSGTDKERSAFLLPTQAPKPDAIKKEQERHQGTWRVTSFIREGTATPDDIAHSIVRVVEGDHVVWKREGKNFAGTTVKLDPSAKPKTIDVTPDGGPDRDTHILGIYKLEGETLTICMSDKDKPRPKSFQAEKGSRQTLMTFKREKK